MKRPWLPIILGLVFLAGLVLRLLWATDIEFKSDEEYMFDRAIRVGVTEPWPDLGMPSGVHIRNPGLSIWVFVWLARIVRAATPVGLAQGVMALNALTLGVALLWAWRTLRGEERESWLWGLSLIAVNPFSVWYQRKIWAQSVLFPFSFLFLISWRRRETRLGAFLWGLIGAGLGQIHMSGFFFAAGFALWTALRSRARWSAWFVGSTIGAIPLVPWFLQLLQTTRGSSPPITHGLGELLQFKYWVFWITDPTGLHLGTALGVAQGVTWRDQLADFFRYPLLAQDQPSWGMAIAHGLLLALSLAILLPGLGAWVKRRRSGIVDSSFTSQSLAAGLWGYGGLLSFSTILIRRYYLLITYPLEFVGLARLALRHPWGPDRARQALVAFWILQFAVSLTFLAYVHRNGGAPCGDYGESYRARFIDHTGSRCRDGHPEPGHP